MKGIMRLIIAILAFTCLSSSLTAEVGRLSARGEARLFAAPDQMKMSVGVVTESKAVQQALTQNSTAINDIMEVVRSLDLKDLQLQTSTFRIDPVWQTKPQNPTPDWRPTVISFRVTHLLEISTSDLSASGKLIDAVVNAGANDVSSLSFELKDPESVRSKAIALATSKAIDQAKVAAKAANITLGPVLSLNIDNAGISPPVLLRAMEAATAVTAGEIEISATVNVELEIQPH